jgi:hypothetical protein
MPIEPVPEAPRNPASQANRSLTGELKATKARAEAEEQEAYDARKLILVAFRIMGVALALTFVGMFWAAYQEVSAFQSGIEAAKSPVNHAAIAAYSVGIVGAVVKTFSILLSFVLIFAGAVYVLLPIQVKYKAGAEGTWGKGTLETNSPGLVMMGIGALLAAFCVNHQVEVNYSGKAPTGMATRGGAQTEAFPDPNPVSTPEAKP